MKPKQEVATRPSENQNQNKVEQSKSSEKMSSQSQSVKQTDVHSLSKSVKLTEEDLPDLKDLEVQKATSLIQVPTYNYPYLFGNIYVSLRLRVQNAVSAQPCVGKFRISLVLLNFLHCNFRLWFETP